MLVIAGLFGERPSLDVDHPKRSCKKDTPASACCLISSNIGAAVDNSGPKGKDNLCSVR